MLPKMGVLNLARWSPWFAVGLYPTHHKECDIQMGMQASHRQGQLVGTIK